MPNVGTNNNKDGLTVKFPGDYARANAPFVNRLKYVAALGPYKYYTLEFDLETVGATATYFPFDLNNDGVRDGFNIGEAYLPAGCTITRAHVTTTEVASGGTSFTIGTYSAAGVARDAAGIVTATNGAIANMGTLGELIIGTGADVGTATGTVGIPSDSWLAVTTAGTFTAGKGTLVLEVMNVQ